MKTIGSFFQTLLLVVVLFVGGLTAAGFFGDSYWGFDLASHFRIAYVAILTVCMLSLALLRGFSGSVLCAVFIGLNLIPIVPFYTATGPLPEHPTPIKLVQMNVWGRNPSCAPAANTILDTLPDFVSVVEATEACIDDLKAEGLYKHYPHHYYAPPTRLLLLSRFPLDSERVQYVRAGNGSSIVATASIGKKTITVVMAHTTRPQTEEMDANQQRHVDELIALINTQKNPVVLIGDLNTTPFSRTYRRLLMNTNLRDSQEGFGLQPSWPNQSHLVPGLKYVPPILPIDHVLVSPAFFVLSRSVGKPIGSDHLPVITELGLQR